MSYRIISQTAKARWRFVLALFCICFNVDIITSHGDEHHDEVTKVTPQINSGECELVNIPVCRHLLKNLTNLPNILGHSSQAEILNSSAYRFLHEVSDALYRRDSASKESEDREELHRCILQIHQLACHILTPKCYQMDRVSVSGIPPCSRVCTYVKDRCAGHLSRMGVQWPLFLSCDAMVECHLPSVCLGIRQVLTTQTQTKADVLPYVIQSRRPRPQLPVGITFRHHSERSARKALIKLARQCSDIMRMYTIGQSVLRKPLLVIEISDKPGVHEPLEPEVKYIGAIHGNEVLGKELLIQLTQYICKKWKARDRRVIQLVKNTRIHIMPCMNPDGYSLAARQGPLRNDWLTGRYNHWNFDLNRSFPDLTSRVFKNEVKGGPNHHIPIPDRYWRRHRQKIFPEVHAVIKWIDKYPFVLSAQLHGGELVANYPYDIQRPQKGTSSNGMYYYGVDPLYTASPDDKVFRHLAATYARSHRTMAHSVRNTCEEKFGERGGITNGAEWYSVYGGMQDFNYLYSNSFEILIELSCRKFVTTRSLPREWLNNREALLKYMEQAHIGIKGFVKDMNGRPVEGAEIQVKGIDHYVTTTKDGEYWRLLTPGNYSVTALKGAYSARRSVTVDNRQPTAARYDFILPFTLSNKIHTEKVRHEKEDKIIIKYPKNLHGHHEPDLITTEQFSQSLSSITTTNPPRNLLSRSPFNTTKLITPISTSSTRENIQTTKNTVLFFDKETSKLQPTLGKETRNYSKNIKKTEVLLHDNNTKNDNYKIKIIMLSNKDNNNKTLTNNEMTTGAKTSNADRDEISSTAVVQTFDKLIELENVEKYESSSSPEDVNDSQVEEEQNISSAISAISNVLDYETTKTTIITPKSVSKVDAYLQVSSPDIKNKPKELSAEN